MMKSLMVAAALFVGLGAQASDPFAQGDKILKGAEKKSAVLARVHPKTGETVLFDATGFDKKALKALDSDAARADFAKATVARFENTDKVLDGQLQVPEHHRPTAAWYGYYYYYPVYYYTPVYYRTYYYTYPYYYGGYRWYIYY